MTDPEHTSENPGSREGPWVHELAEVIKRTGMAPENRMRTMLSCNIKSSKPSLYVPPDMAELQPRNLRYLHAFAKANDLKLVEDRRRVAITPAVEQRDSAPPMIALGLSMLLKQTGMPGAARSLSKPHRLRPDSPHIGIARLIHMASCSAEAAKRVVLLPNRLMVNVLDNDTQPITGYACKLMASDNTTILSHFDSPRFRAIGYSAGTQYIIHICLAGGPVNKPGLWTHLHTLTRTHFRIELFPGATPSEDFGLLYATFYMDVATAPLPWWLDDDPQPPAKPALARHKHAQDANPVGKGAG